MLRAVKSSDVVLTYAESFIEQTILDLRTIEQSFFKIGFRLNEAVNNNYVEALGYSDIYELAEDQFGFKKTTTKNLMEVNRTYSTGYYGRPTMEIDDKFKGFSQTQLVEMLPIQSFSREHIPVTFTARDIRDYKKITAVDFDFRTVGADSFTDLQTHPAKYITVYRNKKATGEIVEEQKKKVQPVEEYTAEDHTNLMKNIDRLIKPVKSDVAPGQISMDEMFAEEMQTGRRKSLDDALLAGEEIFVQNPVEYNNVEKVSQSTDRKLYNFKNDEERCAFLKDVKNYPVVVLRNSELGLTVRRCDLPNGAKIYRSEYYVCWSDNFEPDLVVSLRLIIPAGQSNDVKGSFRSFSRTWTSSNDGESNIAQYLKQHRHEI